MIIERYIGTYVRTRVIKLPRTRYRYSILGTSLARYVWTLNYITHWILAHRWILGGVEFRKNINLFSSIIEEKKKDIVLWLTMISIWNYEERKRKKGRKKKKKKGKEYFVFVVKNGEFRVSWRNEKSHNANLLNFCKI